MSRALRVKDIVPVGDSTLTEKEKYLFDLRGYVVLKNFISPAEVKEMNRVIDGQQKEGQYQIKFPFLEHSPLFMDLFSDPRVMNICKHWVGDYFRFDHAYGLQMPPADGKITIPKQDNLHGGPNSEQGAFTYGWYQDRSQVGLLAFAYAMEPVKRGDGGFIVVPGSHNTHRDVGGKEIFEYFLNEDVYNAEIVENPELEAGDLLIFAEALTHGTRAWTPVDRGRRILFYKYCPGYMCWRYYDETKKYLSLARNELERSLLRAPGIAGYHETEAPMWRNHAKGPTLPTGVKQRIQKALKKVVSD